MFPRKKRKPGLESHPEQSQGTPATLFLPREPLAARLAAAIGRHHALLMVLCAVFLWLIVGASSFNALGEYRKGDTATRDIIAPHTALIPDRKETNSRRRAAAALVPPVYQGDPTAQERALSQFQRFLAGPQYAGYSQLERKRIATAGESAIRTVYHGGQIRSDVSSDLGVARARVAASIRALTREMDLSEREAATALALAQKTVIVPNLIVDEQATLRAQSEAQRNIREVFERVSAGDVLVLAGETLDAERWDSLVALGMVAPRFDGSTAMAQFALCALLVLLAGSYLSAIDSDLLKRPSALWLAAMTPVFFLLVFRFLLRIPHADFLLVPLATCGAILLTVLLNARLGLLAGLFIGALGTLMLKSDVGLFLPAILVPWSGALSTSHITSRGHLVRAGVWVSLASGALMGTLGFLHGTALTQLLPLAVSSALGGGIAVLVAVGLAMLLERPFGITTPLRLMELLAPNEAVLRRLQTEAPGTYTHSIMVSLLGEAGAKAVDADPLLCRVGGLYHDIGKLRHPHCFVENQGSENMHDRLTPTQSARLILAHVEDGVALGRALKLPRPVLDIIATHHGKSRVEYFYRQALSQNETPRSAGSSHLAIHRINEEDFRYPGPRPQTKEAAIILLADAVEASSRALTTLTAEKLENHIQSIINARLREGELASCDLTLRDLGRIKTAFLHVLKGALHQRIVYPTPEKSLPSEENRSRFPASAEADVMCIQEALAESFLASDEESAAAKTRSSAARG